MKIPDFFNEHFQPAIVTCIIVGLISYLLMKAQSRHFLTLARIRQPFSIFDLQFSASKDELERLLGGIKRLDEREAESSSKALRKNLWLDFLLMPCIYIGITLVCFMTYGLMDSLGKYVFVFLGFLQVIPWLCDIYENTFLLRRIPEPFATPASFNLYLRCVQLKWFIASISLVTALSMLLFIFVK